MRKCPKCGKTYDDRASICLSCGDTLTIYEAASEEKKDTVVTTSKEELKKYFQNVFTKFDSGKSPISWNWYAFIFSWPWYMFKGMWPKVFLYMAISWALNTILMLLALSSFTSMLFFSLFLYVAENVYFGALANYDYYLYKRKAEFFWPKLPYKKLKIPFWSAIVAILLYYAVFQGMAATKAINTFATTFARDAKPGAIKSFVDEKIQFGSIPSQWLIYKNPPGSFNFSLTASHPVGTDSSEYLTYSSLPGTKFMGYIEEGQGKEKIYKGLIVLIENKPRFNSKFSSIQDGAVVKKAKIIAGAGEMPFYMKWLRRWMSTKPSSIEYVEFSGYKWGLLRNDIETNFVGNKTTFYINVYWTIADGKAVYVLSEAFEPYKDNVKAQVESFLTSFSVRQ